MGATEVLYREYVRQYEEGKKEGIRENTIEIAKKMLQQNISIEVISKITGISETKVKKIKSR